MSVSDELGRLGDLHQRGVLSDEEFARAKARVLDAAPTPGAAPATASALHGFHRSTTDRFLGGVCGGIAQSTGLPSWLWRVIFVFGVLFAGTGLLLYVLLWIFVPPQPLYLPGPSDHAPAG